MKPAGGNAILSAGTYRRINMKKQMIVITSLMLWMLLATNMMTVNATELKNNNEMVDMQEREPDTSTDRTRSL